LSALLQDVLGETPLLDKPAPVEWDAVGHWLRTHYFGEAEKARIAMAKRRHELYSSGGDADMCDFLGQVVRDPSVLQRRRDWVEKAKFNNVIRRIVNELSMVYSEPAQRRVEDRDDAYQELQRTCRQHEMFQRVNRWGNLHRNLAVGFRVRVDSGGRRVPVIDVVAPDAFRAVAHPFDPTRLVALIFDLKYVSDRNDLPGHLVWTDRESFYMTREGYVLTETVVPHGFERMPWILFALEPPAGGLLDSRTGEDLVAAHRSVWFEMILLLKESKSATKQTILTGDVGGVSRHQALDSETPIELADGVAVNTVDMSMDLSMFSTTARTIFETAAANYGIPPSLLSHAGTQSADARELMRAPLKELRKEQLVYFRQFEREFASIQSMVLERDMPELAFGMGGWRVDFAESETPLSPKEELEVFEHARRLGLTNTLSELMRRNPDLDAAGALVQLQDNVKLETLRNELMRPLQEISGSMGADTPTAQDSTAPDAAVTP